MRRLSIILFLSLILLLGNSSGAASQFLEAGVQKLKVPVSAPDFTLGLLGGGHISLKELGGKVVVLYFFAPWCEVCLKESASFDELAGEFKGKAIAFLLVAIREDEKDLMKFKKKSKLSLPILIDEKGQVAKAYKVFGHHEIYFIDPKGKILGKTFAVKDWTSDSMRKLIQHLLAEGG